MITEAVLAEYRRQLGKKVHYNDGVWWEEKQRFYCKPVFEFRSFHARSARPSFRRSWLGYSHQIPDAARASRSIDFMVLEGPSLRTFSLSLLRAEKRNQVRKGLRLCLVQPLGDIEAVLETMREINIAQAIRQRRNDAPPTQYLDGAEAWRKEIRTYFSQSGREWWGAFYQNRLVAYMITVQVEDVLVIEAMKSHTEALKFCPTDAIYYTVLEDASKRSHCLRVVNGAAGKESLNRFKEQFLFQRKPYYYYTSHVLLFRLARTVQTWLRALQRRNMNPPLHLPESPHKKIYP